MGSQTFPTPVTIVTAPYSTIPLVNTNKALLDGSLTTVTGYTTTITGTGGSAYLFVGSNTATFTLSGSTINQSYTVSSGNSVSTATFSGVTNVTIAAQTPYIYAPSTAVSGIYNYKFNSSTSGTPLTAFSGFIFSMSPPNISGTSIAFLSSSRQFQTFNPNTGIVSPVYNPSFASIQSGPFPGNAAANGSVLPIAAISGFGGDYVDKVAYYSLNNGGFGTFNILTTTDSIVTMQTAASPTGSHIITAMQNGSANTIDLYSTNVSTGTSTFQNSQTSSTGIAVYLGVAFDYTGRNIYVLTGGTFPNGKTLQYSFSNGTCTFVNSLPFNVAPLSSFQGIIYPNIFIGHPTRPLLFCSVNSSSTVAIYNITTATTTNVTVPGQPYSLYALDNTLYGLYGTSGGTFSINLTTNSVTTGSTYSGIAYNQSFYVTPTLPVTYGIYNGPTSLH